MRSLNDFLHQTESRRGEGEAGHLRFLYLLFLLFWSILQIPSITSVIIPVSLILINSIFLVFNRNIKLSPNPYLILSFEIVLATFWSFNYSGSESFPIVPVLLFLLYCASLRLKVNLIVMAGVESIISMNFIYLYSLFSSSKSLSDNILNWPGFSYQIFLTAIVLCFTYAMLSRPRIIRRLVNQQQVYFEMVRDENIPLRDSLDEISKHFSLSSREKDVLSVLIQGKTYRMIAGELFISVDTVKSHVKSIYRKCEVGSKTELLAVLQDLLQETVLVREKKSE